MGSQWSMMQGEVPDEGLAERLFTLYVISFHLVVFFLLVNFFLAIIVEAFLHSKQDTVINDTELSFLQDVIWTIQATILGLRYRWPRRMLMVQKLEKFTTYRVTDSMMEEMFPTWSAQSRAHFFKYYLSHDFCHLKQHHARLKHLTRQGAVDEIERRIQRVLEEHTLMLGQTRSA